MTSTDTNSVYDLDTLVQAIRRDLELSEDEDANREWWYRDEHEYDVSDWLASDAAKAIEDQIENYDQTIEVEIGGGVYDVMMFSPHVTGNTLVLEVSTE